MTNQIIIENIILPNKPLNNFELMEAVKKLNINHFRGVFMSDQLPRKPNKIECGIMNLDDESDKKVKGSKGTHWVCYYKKNKHVSYFDSFGIQPTLEIVDYLKNNEIKFNTFQLQSPHQLICGHLCLFTLFHLQKENP